MGSGARRRSCVPRARGRRSTAGSPPSVSCAPPPSGFLLSLSDPVPLSLPQDAAAAAAAQGPRRHGARRRRISPSPPSVLHLRAGDPRPRNSGRPLPRPLPRLHRASEGSARVDRASRPSALLRGLPASSRSNRPRRPGEQPLAFPLAGQPVSASFCFFFRSVNLGFSRVDRLQKNPCSSCI